MEILGALSPAWCCCWWGRSRSEWLKFFAGFCLIANGCYLGVGWIWHSGDAGELLQLGTPIWVLVIFGIITFISGLVLWHQCRWLTIRSPAEANA